MWLIHFAVQQKLTKQYKAIIYSDKTKQTKTNKKKNLFVYIYLRAE